MENKKTREQFSGNLSKTIKFALKLKNDKAVRNMEELREHFDINEIMESFLDGKLSEWLSDRRKGTLSKSVENLKIELDAVKKDDEKWREKARDVAEELCSIFKIKMDGGIEKSIDDLDISAVDNLRKKEDYLNKCNAENEIIKNRAIVAHNQDELNRLLVNGVKRIYLFAPMQSGVSYEIKEDAVKEEQKFFGVGSEKVNIRILGQDNTPISDEGIEQLCIKNNVTLKDITYRIDDDKENPEPEKKPINYKSQQNESSEEKSSRDEVHDRLIRYMDACFPLIYLTTFEEEKVDNIIRSVADGREIIEWNAQGFFIYTKEGDLLKSSKREWSLTDTLGVFINDVLCRENEFTLNDAILVLKDAQKLLEDWHVVAQLKYLSLLIYEGKLINCNIIIVSQVLEIPKELENYLTVMNLDHLTTKEIHKIVNDFCVAQDVPTPSPKTMQKLVVSLKGLSEFDIVNILAFAVSDDRELTGSDIDEIMEHKKRMISKANVLEMVDYKKDNISLGGMGELQKWLDRKAKIFESRDAAIDFGVITPKGMLVAGMPGCGKSLCAKATAEKFKMPLLRMDMGRIMGKYVGESEGNMRRALEMSKAIAPCVLWIDEIEKAFSGIGSEGGTADVTTRLFGSFLTWMQEKTEAVFVVATANDITKLPPELLRKGRFDEIFFVDLPNSEERKEIFEIHMKRRKKENEWKSLEKKHVDEIVYATEGYSGADIEGVVSEAVEIAFCKQNDNTLTKEILLETIKSTVPLSQINKTAIGSLLKLYQQNNFRKASGEPKQTLWKILKDGWTHQYGRLKGGYNSWKKKRK